MNRLWLRFVAAALLGQVLSLESQAQLVQVGPGYVKAPFVRVYWNPDGSSYVRAPFVSVHSPGYAVANVPDGECLRNQLIASAAELDRSLARFKTGEGWQQYLVIPPGIEKPTPQRNDVETAQLAVTLQQTLSRFDAVRQNGEYRVIARLPAFTATGENLAAYVKYLQNQPEQPAAEELPLPQKAN